MPNFDLGRAVGEIIINADQALTSYRRVSAAHAGTVSSMTKVEESAGGTAFALKAIGAAAAVGFAMAVREAAKFQQQLSFYGAVTGATTKQIAAVREEALKIDQVTGVGIQSVAAAFVELGKSGVTSKQIIAGVGQATVDLARATDISASNSADIIVNVSHTFGIAAKNAASIADTLAGAANASTIDMTELALGLKYAGASAANLGIPFKQLADAIAYLGNQGIRGSTAGTSLRMMLVSLAGRTGPATDELKALGIITKDGSNAFFDAAGNAKSMADIAQVLQDSTAGLSAKQKEMAFNTIFGNRAMSSAILLARGGAAAINSMDKQVGKVTAQQVMEQRMNNLSGAFQRFKVAIQIAAIQIGSPFLKPLQLAVQFITGLINRLNGAGPAIAKFFSAFNSRTSIGATFADIGKIIANVDKAIGNLTRALLPLLATLVLLGGTVVVGALHVLAALLAGVTGVLVKLTGFFVNNKAAAYALAGVIIGALVPALVAMLRSIAATIALRAMYFFESLVTGISAMVAAFAIADGAVASFGAALEALSLNPIAVAIGIVGLAVGGLIALFHGSDAAARRAKQSVDDYAASLHTNVNDINSVTASEKALNDMLNRRISTINKMNISQLSTPAGRPTMGRGEQNDTSAQLTKNLADMRKEALANDPALKELQVQIAKLNESASKAGTNTSELSAALGVNKSAIRGAANALGMQLDGAYASLLPKIQAYIANAKLSHEPTQQAAADMKNFGNEANTASDDIALLDQQYADLIGNFLSSRAGYATAIDSIHTLRKSLQASGGSLKETSAKGRAAIEQLSSTSDQVSKTIQGLYNQNGHWTKATMGDAKRLINMLVSTLPKGSAAAKHMRDQYNQYLQDVVAESGTKGKKAADNFASSALGQTGKVVNAASKIVGALLSHLTSSSHKARDPGLNFTAGFASGILGNLGLAISASVKMVQAAIAAAKHAAASHSPARKMIPVGHDFVGGWVLGVTQKIAAARKAVHDMIQAAIGEAKKAKGQVARALAASVDPGPQSKRGLARELGRQLHNAIVAQRAADKQKSWAKDLAEHAKKVQHEVNKLDKSLDKASKSQSKHAAELKKSYDKTAAAAQHMADQASKAYDKLKAKADNANQKAQETAQSLVDSVQQAADNLVSELNTLQQTLAQDIMGSNTVSSVWQQLLSDGTASVGGLQGSMDQILHNVRRFAKDLSRLQGMGASEGLLSQIASLGPEQGDMLARELLAAGKGAVHHLNKTTGMIDKISNRTATSLAEGYYKAGVHAMEHFIKGLIARFPELRKALKPILAELRGVDVSDDGKHHKHHRGGHGGGGHKGHHPHPKHHHPRRGKMAQGDAASMATDAIVINTPAAQSAATALGEKIWQGFVSGLGYTTRSSKIETAMARITGNTQRQLDDIAWSVALASRGAGTIPRISASTPGTPQVVHKKTEITFGDVHNPKPETNSTSAARRMRTLAMTGPWSD